MAMCSSNGKETADHLDGVARERGNAMFVNMETQRRPYSRVIGKNATSPLWEGN